MVKQPVWEKENFEFKLRLKMTLCHIWLGRKDREIDTVAVFW